MTKPLVLISHAGERRYLGVLTTEDIFYAKCNNGHAHTTHTHTHLYTAKLGNPTLKVTSIGAGLKNRDKVSNPALYQYQVCNKTFII